MEKIKTILGRKQSHFIKILPNSSLHHALVRMSSQGIECMVVMDEAGSFLGLLTEHDIARKTVLSENALMKTTVFDLMSTHFPFADINDSVEHCMRLMKQFNVRYLPVFEDRIFRGVVSTEEILGEAVQVRNEIFDEEPSLQVSGYW